MKKFTMFWGIVLILALVLAGSTHAQNMLTEGFETGQTNNTDIAGTWTQARISGTNNWIAYTYNSPDYYTHTGTFNAILQGSSTTWMFKSVSLTGGVTYKLSFYSRCSVGSTGYIKASYGTAATAVGMTTAIVAQTTLATTDYQLLTGTLTPATTGTYYIGFLGNNSATLKYTSVDDISLDIVGTPLTGSKTIKTGGDYATFTSAILALNACGVGTGGVTFTVDAGLTFTEDCPAIVATGTSSDPVVFQKLGTGNNPIIKPTGVNGMYDAGIRIMGGDYFTFDGIDITILSGSGLEYGYSIYNTTVTNGAQYNTIKNSKITLSKANGYSMGICQNVPFTPTSAAGANSYNSYYNITVEVSNSGIQLLGNSTYPDIGCVIGTTGTGTTTIGSATAYDISNDWYTVYGIRCSNQKDVQVFNTEVRNVKTVANSTNAYGISMEAVQGTSSVYNNKIHDISSTSTTATEYVYGLKISGASTAVVSVYNNVIYNFAHSVSAASATTLGFGIYAITNSGTMNFYYNSVNMNFGVYVSNIAFYLAGAGANVKNNIFVNASTYNATSKRYCYYAYTVPTSTSNNILYINTASGATNLVGYYGGDRQTLQKFAAALTLTSPSDGMEAGSANANPKYTSATSMVLTNLSPARYGGTPITGITTDITGATRDVTRPNIGAYETAVTLADSTAPILNNVVITGSGSTTPSVSVTLTDNSAGASNATVRLWYRDSTSSGTFTALDADTKPSGAMNGTYTWSTSLTSLAKGTYKFYITARDVAGAGKNISINPIWAVGFAGFSAADPPNFTANPDANANTRSFQKLNSLAGGTYNVGALQTLKKLTDVANELNNVSLTGNVIYELNSDYDGTTGETFPIVFNQIATSGGNWTATIRVKSGAGARTTSGSTANPLIRLNGADNITFDGREGGTGSAIAWNFLNTYTNSYPFIFQNDATYDTVRYCNVKGVSGGFYFHSNVLTTGNDNNTIANCKIGGIAGLAYPTYGIYSSGTSGKENSGNTVSDNEIYDFRTSNAAGIYLAGNNIGWSITGNSFYQSAAYTGVAGTMYGIYVNGGDGHTISGNKIGGSSANCSGTWTVNGTAANSRFTGINIAGPTTVSSVQNNTIANFDWLTTNNSTTAQGAFCGICVGSGKVDVGSVSPNIIGGGADNIKVTSTVSCLLVGLYASSENGVSIANNSISGLTNASATATIESFVTGIQTTNQGIGVLFTISGNTVGSTTVAGSLRAGTSGTTTGATYVKGIDNSAYGPIVVSGNTVANLVSNGANLLSTVTGITSSQGVDTIKQNIVRDLTTASINTGTVASASVIGISMTSSSSTYGVGALVTQNTVYGLNNTAASAAVAVTGIHYAGATTGTNTVSRNLIYGLSVASTNALCDIRGLNYASGLATVQNNMIRLGYNSAGAALTNGIQIAGMYEVANTANTAMYFNSVYIGGAVADGAGTSKTYAFRSAVTTNVRTYKNNIFVNARSNAGTGGTHYALLMSGTLANPTGLTSNYNIVYAPSSDALAYYNTDINSLSGWRTATGQDNSSGVGDPNFVNATAATPDLHVQSPTPAEGSGVVVATITDDFDGGTRADLTPVDIGADAGAFTGADIFPPSISYSATGNGTTANKVLTNFATITDNVAVSSDANAPRLYFKKKTDTDAFAGNTSSDNGWKFVIGARTSSYNFTVNYSIINGGSVSVGDTIQYFIVAQDAANNLSSMPNGATTSGTPSVQNINGKATTPNSYAIVPAITGSITVGTSGTYTTLTGAGGLFAAINSGFVTGDVTVSITSDITETGTNALNQWLEEGTGGYILEIQPDGTTLRTISATAVATGSPMIDINGADSVVIDGGAGKYLTFRNTNSTPANAGPTFKFYNSARRCVLTNCTIESNETNTSRGAIVVGNESQTDTTSIVISYNDIRDATAGTTGAYASGVYISTTYPTLNASVVTIRNNNIFNFISTGVRTINVKNGISIASNSFYNNLSTAPTTSQQAMFVTGYSLSVTGNYIGGSAPECGGTPYIQNGNSSTLFYGISIAPSGYTDATASSIQGNIIQNISLTGDASFRGIFNQNGGPCNIGNVTGNLIGNTTNTKTITIGTTKEVYGIYSGTSGGSTTINNNTIGYFNFTNATPGGFIGIYYCGGPSVTVMRNKIFAISSTSSMYGFWERGIQGTTTYTVANNQIILGRGITGTDAIYGIYSLADTNNTLYKYYNTITIGGSCTGIVNSICYYKSKCGVDTLRNNIFLNERTNTSTGKSYAIYSAYKASTSGLNADYNLYVVPDTAVFAYDTTAEKTFAAWKSSLGFDNYSYGKPSALLTSTDLFTDPAAGNLNINTANVASWEVNNIGIAIPSIGTDYAGNTRGTSVGVPVDIGSNEFTTGTTPPSVTVASPVVGDNLFVSRGRTLANVIFTADGTRPTSLVLTYYPGMTPPNSSVGKNLKSYWTIEATGGSGYSYSLTLNSSPAELNGITPSNLKIAKSSNGGTTWSLVGGTASGYSATVTGQTLFSTFTLTDATNSLPVELTAFTASANKRDVLLNWSTATEVNCSRFIVERRNGVKWDAIGNVEASGTSNAPKQYSTIDKALENGRYVYRLRIVDNDGQFELSDTIETTILAPIAYGLGQNFPNPFNPSTRITFAVHATAHVNICVYNILGEQVMELFNATAEGGKTHTVTLDATSLSTGVYFYQMRTDGTVVETRKMILQK